nr:competence protein ComK [Gracilibacillus boraciitolerans]
MMETNYRITTNTLALFPMHDLHRQSTIFEVNTSLTSNQKSLDIIKENCLHYGSTYHGRKASVQHHLGYQQKTPILFTQQRASMLTQHNHHLHLNAFGFSSMPLHI